MDSRLRVEAATIHDIVRWSVPEWLATGVIAFAVYLAILAYHDDKFQRIGKPWLVQWLPGQVRNAWNYEKIVEDGWHNVSNYVTSPANPTSSLTVGR